MQLGNVREDLARWPTWQRTSAATTLSHQSCRRMVARTAGRHRPGSKNVVLTEPSTIPSARNAVTISHLATSPNVLRPLNRLKISSLLRAEYFAWNGDTDRMNDFVNIFDENSRNTDIKTCPRCWSCVRSLAASSSNLNLNLKLNLIGGKQATGKTGHNAHAALLRPAWSPWPAARQ
eukprot:SAG31_NODE_3306_length_4437_cov_46.404564_4_plen_177_part_00